MKVKKPFPPMSFYIAIDLFKSLKLKVYITLSVGKKSVIWSLRFHLPIGIGREKFSLLMV